MNNLAASGSQPMAASSFDAAAGRLARHRQVWETKTCLRQLYGEWYAQIKALLAPGLSVELGSGPGNLKTYLPDAISTDIVQLPWLNAVLDAVELPFRTGSLGNLVLFDVLHHLAAPADFFHEAARVLAPGGRIVIVDPYISPASHLVFCLFHPEPVDFRQDPLASTGMDRRKDPFVANQAFATRLFWRDLEGTLPRLPDFRLVHRSRSDMFRYPMSGGFDHAALAPGFVFEPLRWLEQALPVLLPLLAFRTVVALERVPMGGRA
jgi:SAM-dependent methyltransferase